MPDSFTSNDPYTKARLVAMGALPAQPDMQTMTLANSINTPYSQAKYDSLAQASDQGVSPSDYAAAEAYKQSRIVKGAVTGQTPTNNMIAPTDTTFQAYTRLFTDKAKEPSNKIPVSSAPVTHEIVAGYTDSDGVYHSPTITNPTVRDVYGNLVTNDTGLDKAYEALGKYIEGTQAPIDEQAIRNQTMQRFQNEIDALNNYYAEKKRQMLAIEAPKAENRLGTNAAISARRGMIGSDFGATQTQNVMDLNAERQNQIISSVDAEKNAAIEAKRAEAMGASEDEINRLRNAQAQGLTANIDLQEKMAKYQDDKVTKAVNSLAMSGQTVSDADLEQLASSLGVSPLELKARYNVATSGSNEKPIEVGGALVDPATGKVIYQAPKEVTAGASLFDPKTGQFIGTAPQKPSDNKPIIEKFADDTTRQWDPATQTWKVLASGSNGIDDKLLSPTEAAALGVAYGTTRREAAAMGIQRNMTPAETQNFMAITSKYQADPIIKQGDQAISTSQIADQVLADPSKATNQLKALYGFVHNLDPQSAVREGEIGLANTTQSYFDRFGTALTRISSGQTISPKVAVEMANATKELAQAWADASQRQTKKYSAQAKGVGLENQFNSYLDLAGTNLKPTSTSGNFVQVKVSDIENTLSRSLNPELRQQAESLIQSRPDLSLDQVLHVMGFKVESQTSLNGTPTPVQNNVSAPNSGLSIKYESGGDPGAIGYDTTGGYSYGKYQLAHNNAKAFINQSPFASEFAGLTFNSPQWRAKWKEVAANNPDAFSQAQDTYIERTHLNPQVEKLVATGIDINKYSPVLRDVIFSTSVQHGPGTDVIQKAFRNAGPNASEDDIIRAIYKERWNGGRRFASSTPAVRKAVFNRFFGANGEMNTALKQLGSIS